MKGFNFEKNLIHQTKAVESTVGVFENLAINQPIGTEKQCVNPSIEVRKVYSQYYDNIGKLQSLNGIKKDIKAGQNIIDIMMETGTGKTYTYTKTIFELNKNFGIFKFVIIVPTLSIKAGTINFLKSPSARQHFKEQYGKTLKLHIVESKKGNKSKKSYMPPAVNSFVNAGTFEKNQIQVLIINAGMINSETMQKSFDKSLFDKYAIPFEALSAVKPFLIVDEPHKFATVNKTWQNIQKMTPQFILRYGATFKDYENLIYTLTAVDSFNQNLVKGVIGHITEFESGKNSIVKLINTNGIEATFELNENTKKKTFKISKKESLEKVHSAMSDLLIENLNKTTVVLSNGLILKKGDKINPYSYAVTLQDIMIKKAIKSHFKLEKEYLTRDVKIKPLTLFFIDNIEEYRGEKGSIKLSVEKYIKAEIEELLKTEKKGFYKTYLEKTLLDISKTHGGYFSKDNSEKDEAIEKEINEILHDKQAMLDLENPRRFIFSKWTLREGWDNPNVFQICKLRSSGSDISKLQEVGRGLRLPVNEYNNRVKDEQFYLNYFVDFTESDFVDKLVNEINEKSGAFSIEETPDKLHDTMIQQICDKYAITEDKLLKDLDGNGIINRKNEFKDNGFDYIKKNYPLIFEGVGSSKVRKVTDEKKKVSIRTEKYAQLKDLWEKLNEKVVLEYKFENETKFKSILIDFLKEQKDNFSIDGVRERKAIIEIEDNQAITRDEISVLDNKITQVSTMKYSVFLLELSKAINVNLKTLHQSFIDSKIKINDFLNASTIRIIKQNFNNYLMYQAFSKFEIDYKTVASSIHPTKITDSSGQVLDDISASDVGVLSSDENVASNYLFNELFYDSELEKENIKTKIEEVVIFSKIPKNSIKIPVAGGKSYSPDFAYVLNFEDGKKKLYFIVETKNTQEESLREEEKQKIKHAQTFFNDAVKITFKTQFSNKKIIDLISDINA
ncbi:type III restriction-modification system endonuclease [Tenacibaculum finnmarkense genomovar finnmarkense]|uniref:type III restriction-modification system endonuclease n=1 Tax=Tenacibaculum finnmarkense TaxID=2781243 RepID=UPI001EFAC1D0|nr:type III restriction-modification system endonuclease [Tenacibaculum finnmarkense]MCG8203332.1 type III restriction-modification system endonuclease [Tenacibaculum finnmarkense genomovar finnmarkense]MCM8896638.1 type III restriction-modification system endonuclease [Tenacibaculum finnmarkense genomovar finnmarkense]